jgi:hypothetical protein
MPAGTELVLATVDRGTRKPGPSFFMVKGADGGAPAWRFGVVEVTRREDTSLCARCHGEAAHDGVFALPE